MSISYQPNNRPNNETHLLRLIFIVLFSIGLATLLMFGCAPKSYQFAQYAVRTGVNIAGDAGIFKEHQFIVPLPKKFGADTVFYYKGVGRYFIQKTDSSYLIRVQIDKQKLEDTTLYYLKKIKNKKRNDQSKHLKNSTPNCYFGRDSLFCNKRNSEAEPPQRISEPHERRGDAPDQDCSAHSVSENAYTQRTQNYQRAFDLQGRQNKCAIHRPQYTSSAHLCQKPALVQPRLTNTQNATAVLPKIPSLYPIYGFRSPRLLYCKGYLLHHLPLKKTA